jgi:hypothetical protein
MEGVFMLIGGEGISYVLKANSTQFPGDFGVRVG